MGLFVPRVTDIDQRSEIKDPRSEIRDQRSQIRDQRQSSSCRGPKHSINPSSSALRLLPWLASSEPFFSREDSLKEPIGFGGSSTTANSIPTPVKDGTPLRRPEMTTTMMTNKTTMMRNETTMMTNKTTMMTNKTTAMGNKTTVMGNKMTALSGNVEGGVDWSC